ncbi:hypothetical protein GA073_16115 [Vibrio alginolyticus]|nr:hypothetical protein [Vibrio alginolyticus]
MGGIQSMNHNKFILSPIKDILVDVTSACIGIGSGVETYPLCDYVMQSALLKMTGAQEQKMKCICWELATNDYEYRYQRFNLNPFGECSNYQEKKEIYKDLVKQIEKHSELRFEDGLMENSIILQDTNHTIISSFENTNLLVWAKKYYFEYESIWSKITEKYFANKENLFVNKRNIGNDIEVDLVDMYDYLYKHRNRVAHNTLSYQQNLPTLKTLLNENYQYENYFIYFSMLVLIDNIFISLYEHYLKAMNQLGQNM